MPRTEYNEIDANSQFEDYSVAKKQLANMLKADQYTKGLVSTASASVARSVDEQVRRKR